MTPDQFRHLALSMPAAVESCHMGHPDFKAGQKIFASLGYPDGEWGMVKLTPKQQGMIVASRPESFKPATGAWGKRGSTLVLLKALDWHTAASVVEMAWKNVASG